MPAVGIGVIGVAWRKAVGSAALKLKEYVPSNAFIKWLDEQAGKGYGEYDGSTNWFRALFDPSSPLNGSEVVADKISPIIYRLLGQYRISGSNGIWHAVGAGISRHYVNGDLSLQDAVELTMAEIVLDEVGDFFGFPSSLISLDFNSDTELFISVPAGEQAPYIVATSGGPFWADNPYESSTWAPYSGQGAIYDGCFLAGTPILMADGARKNIEDIKVGDEVFAFDVAEEAGRGDFYPRKVSKIFIGESDNVVKLDDLNVTLGHVCLDANGSFRQLQDILKDAAPALVDEAGNIQEIASVREVPGVHTIYNFEVEGLHTYIAGKYRVHNKSQLVDDIDTDGDGVNDKKIRFTLEETGEIIYERVEKDKDDPDKLVYTKELELSVDEDGNSSVVTIAKRLLIDEDGDGVDDNQALRDALDAFGNSNNSAAFFELIDNQDAEGQLESLFVNAYEADEQIRSTISEGTEIGQRFGSQLGNVVNLNNPFADTIFDAALVVLGRNLGEIISNGGVTAEFSLSGTRGQTSPDGSPVVENLLEGISVELLNGIVDATQGEISSFLSTRFTATLGIEGFVGEFVDELGEAAINSLVDTAQLILKDRNDFKLTEQERALREAGYIANLKTALRGEAETVLVGEFSKQIQGLLQDANLSSTAQNFASIIIDPLIESAVDEALDSIKTDEDKDAKTLSARFKEKASEVASDYISNFVINGVGLEGNSFGEQFGQKLTKQLVGNVVNGVLGIDDASLFGADGVNFGQIFSNIPDVGAKLIIGTLTNKLGLEGVGAVLFEEVGTQVISTIGANFRAGEANLLKGVSDIDELGPKLGQIAVSFASTKLADAIAKNPAGELGAKIGGIVGSTIGNFLPGGSLVWEPVLKVIGALIGNLFGTTPRAGADLVYDVSTGEFAVGVSYKKGKGKREVAEAIAAEAGTSLNSIIDLIGGEVLNPEEITPGHYGTYKNRYTYREKGRQDTADNSFTSVEDLVAFGVLNALEEVKLLGGDTYLKRAFHQSLENQKNPGGVRVAGAEDSAFAKTGNNLSLILADLTVAAEYSKYLEEPGVINALIEASPESAFAVGWAITFQRAYELGLHRRHEADWYGGWEHFLGENDRVASTFEFIVDATNNERLIVINDPVTAVKETVRDTVAAVGKDVIEGTVNNDSIVVNGATLEGLTSSNGLSVNGRTLTDNEDYDIEAAAVIRGGGGNDTIIGGDRGNDLYGEGGNDSLVGGATADWLFGGDGDDTLNAGAGDDGNYLSGDGGNDSIQGASGSDWLAGGNGADMLYGESGDDVIDGGAGVDTVRGGSGDDRYVWRSGDGADDFMENAGGPQAASALQRLADLRNGTGGINWSSGAGAAFTEGGGDTLVLGEGIGFDNILFERIAVAGQEYDDLRIIIDIDRNSATANEALTMREWFNPLKRVEYLQLADGQTINIGSFETFVQGTSGNDTLFGTNGNDFIYGGKGDDNIFLLRGDDFGVGGAGSDLITGDIGDDIVVGGDDSDRVIGGEGQDRVIGGRGADDVYGGAGADLIVGDEGDDTLIGGYGDDIFKISRGDGRDVVFDALTNNWEVVWSGLDNNGDSQPDLYVNGYALNAATGQVTKNGEVVFDGEQWVGRWRYDWTNQALERHITTGINDAADQGHDRIEFDLGIDISDLYGEQRGNDLVIGIADGSGAPASLDDFDDQLIFKDWFSLGAPIEEFLFIGSGLFSLRAFGQELTANKYAIEAVDATGVADGDSGKNIVLGSTGDDTLNGYGGDDALMGQSGVDVLNGGDGDDILMGGAGDDFLAGGFGADTLDGGGGFDFANYAASGSAVTVNLATGTGASGDVYVDIEGVLGSVHADMITGDNGENEFDGGGGADTLSGGFGGDVYVYRSGDGADVINDAGDAPVANARDSIVFEDIMLSDVGFQRDGNDLLMSFAGSTDTIRIVEFTSNGLIEDIIFADGLTVSLDAYADTGTQSADFIAGSSGADTLLGFDGDDTLSGRGGSDRLEGGGGDDLLAPGDATSSVDGGDGVDTLYFGDVAGGVSIDLSTQDGVVTPSGTPMKIQAEDLTLESGFFVSNDSPMAEGGLIIRTAANATGDASVVLSGAYDITPGHYVVTVGYFDESDGQSVLKVLLNGTTDTDMIGSPIVWDGDSGIPRADAANFELAATPAVSLVSGDVIRLSGQADSGEYLRIDYIELVPVSVTPSQYTGIEHVVGSDSSDTVIGDVNANRLDGRAGADTLEGDAGEDTISGGDGNDSLAGGAGDDVLFGDDGADVIAGDDGADLIYGGDGDDVIDTGAGGTRTEQDGSGQDVVVDIANVAYGDGGNDVLSGGADADSLIGGAGDDTLTGGAGADILAADGGNDVVDGGAGADMIVVSSVAQAGGETRVINAQGYDALELGIAGAPEDLWFSLSGSDLRIESFVEPGRSVIVENWVATGPTGLRDNLAHGVRVIYVNGQAISHGAVTALADALSGVSVTTPLSLNDLAPEDRQAVADAHNQYWQSRSDYLDNETLVGGAGADTLTADGNLTGGALIDGGAGNDSLAGAEENDTINGGLGDDYIDGRAGDDVLDGGEGADVAQGGEGDDTLVAHGADALLGGAGSDVYVIGAGASGAEIIESAGDVADEDIIQLTDILRLSDLVAERVSSPAGGLQVVSAVNVAGPEYYSASRGITYAAHSDPADATLVWRDGSASFPDVLQTEDDALYQTYGWSSGSFTYEIPVPDAGEYLVEINLAELHFNLTGQRVFGIALEGQSPPSFTNIDIISLGGQGVSQALQETVTVNDGMLTIQFIDGPDNNPMINAFAVFRAGSSSSGAADDLVFANGKDGTSSLSVKGHFSGGEAVEYLELADGRRFAISVDGTAQDGVNTLITGGDAADTLTGASASDAVYGGGGADSLSGAEGNDALFGNDGADALNGGANDDTLYGGAGADTLDGGTGEDWASYEDSASAILFDADSAAASTGYAQGDVLTNIHGVKGTDYDDTLLGANAAGDVFDGGAGDDSLDGRGGDDVFINGDGADFYEGGAGTDTVIFTGLRSGYDINSGTGEVTNLSTQEVDVVSNVERLQFDDIVVDLGLSPNNAPQIGDNQALYDQTAVVGRDYAFSFPGQGQPGAAFIDPDAGDVLTYTATQPDGSALPSWLTFDRQMRSFSGAPPQGLAGSTLTIRVTADDGNGGAVYKDFVLTFQAAGVLVEGDAGSNYLTSVGVAGEGDDTLRGLDGSDTLEGGAGADSLDGGAGYDYAEYSNASAAVAVDLGAGTGTAGDAAGDILVEIEGLFGSGFNDTLDGGAGYDYLNGNAGDDLLRGHGNDDILIGGAGVDTLDGGAGDDLLRIGDVNDHAYGGAGVDTLDLRSLSAGLAFDLTAQGGQYSGLESIHGTNHNDTLTGDANANRLDGDSGDDVLIGGGGADTMIGGAGSDLASYAYASAGVGVVLDGGAGTGGAAGDVLSEIEHLTGSDFNDTLTGNNLENTIEGGLGDDVINGLGARDHLYGGAGADSLYGGAGGDYLYGGDGNDYIEAGSEGDKLKGDAGDDTLVGGQGSDSYFFGSDTGHDTVDNYDTDQGFDVISYADDVANTDLWFEKVGNDLVVNVLGGASSATIKNWYNASGQPAENFVVDMFVASSRVTREVDVERLIGVMSTISQPASFAALSATDQARIEAAWSPNSLPTVTAVSDVSNVVVAEDGSVTLEFTVGDAEDAPEQLTLAAFTTGELFAQTIAADFVNATTRRITFSPLSSRFGAETVDIVVTDLGGSPSSLPVTITVDEAADAPTLAPVTTPGGNAGQAIALNISAALSDTLGTEQLEIVVSGPDTGWTLNNFRQYLGGGTYVLDLAHLTGLTITPPAGSGADIALTVTARSIVPSSVDASNDIAETLRNVTVSVNGAPTAVLLDNLTIDENVSGDEAGTLSAADPDSGNTFTYDVVGGADAANFEISADGTRLKLKDSVSLDYEDLAQRQQNVTVRATDQDGLFVDTSFVLNVQNRNEKPSQPNAASTTISENNAGLSLTLTGASDPDGTADIDYAFVLDGTTSGNAGGFFTITQGAGNTATLGLNQSLNYEWVRGNLATRDFIKQDAGGYYLEVKFLATETNVTATNAEINVNDPLVSTPQIAKVYVSDVNEAPHNLVRTGGAQSVSEAAGNNAYIATFGATDPDVYNSSFGTLTYSLTNSAGGRFKIDAATGQLRVNNAGAINYESATAHTITVRARDVNNTGLFVDRNFTINVGNVDDTNPTMSLAGGITKPIEGGPAGILVMDVNASDPDGIGSAFTYQIIGGNVGNVFNIDGNGRVTTQGAFDYETRSSYTLQVRVTETDSGQSRTTSYTVGILDGDDHIATSNTVTNTMPLTTDGVNGGYIRFFLQDIVLGLPYHIIRDRNNNQVLFNSFGNGSPNTAPGYYTVRGVPDQHGIAGVLLYRSAGTAFPIVFDLDNDGVEITPIGDHQTVFDMDNDGSRQRTDWVGADDGLLVLDRNGDGVINNVSEISFVEDLPGAKTDLEGLAAFDSNGDGVFDAQDARFGEFQIWRDVNQDGISQASELSSLARAGIASLDLTPVSTGVEIGDAVDALILNTSTFTRTDGTTGEIGDAVFRYATREEDDALPAPSSTLDPTADARPSLPGVRARENDLHGAADGDARLQNLFNGFLGKMQTGEYAIDAGEYTTRQAAAANNDAAAEVGEADAAASLNRLIDAMAAFESSGDGLGVKVRDRESFAAQFREIGVY